MAGRLTTGRSPALPAEPAAGRAARLRLAPGPALLIAALAAACAPAQRPSAPAPAADPAPAAVAQSFFDALHDERWDAAAGHLDLDRFERYLREQLAEIERLDTARIPQVTPEHMMRTDPGMPRDVAEYLAGRARASLDEFAEHIVERFAGVPDRDSLRRLSVRDAAARWIEAQDHRYRMRRDNERLRALGCELPDEVLDALDAPRHGVVGAVVAGHGPADTIAYVLYREVFGDEPPSGAPGPAGAVAAGEEPAAEDDPFVPEPQVLVLRRVAGAWKVVPSAGGFGYGAMATIADCGPAPPAPREP